MTNEVQGLDQATAASILNSLRVLETNASEELHRLNARLITDSVTGQPKSAMDHSIFYKSMAYGWPGVQKFRGEMADLTDEALLSVAYLCEILSFVHWARICVARGGEGWYLLSVTLQRLSAVPVGDLVAARKQAGAQKRGGHTSPKRKAATVKLLQSILREEGDLRAEDLWRLAGSEDFDQYWQVELDGEIYEFTKDEDDNLGISRLNTGSGHEQLKSQPFNSTFRRWCKEAKDALSSPPKQSPPSSL
jgi:hypothetical protein